MRRTERAAVMRIAGTLAALVGVAMKVQAQGAPAPGDPGAPLDFVVGNIQVEGLQRVSEGTVYNYLPVNIGDHLTAHRLREAVRALYATGFFRDVQLRREGSTLVVVLLERPSISSFEITGNKEIKTEELQKSLRNVGLAVGKTLDRSTLEEVVQYLTDQYYSRGKYGVKVVTQVDEESGNRVKVRIAIQEGGRARIRDIHIIGNTKFQPKQILDTLALKTPNWLSWYRQDDRYSRESLQGDLERVRNFYMDRGYANFEITSTQVTISPEKDDIFITLNVSEGDLYTVSQVKLAGTFVVPEAELKKLVLVEPGQTFNRKLITSTQELIQNRLGRDGYAFAKVDPVPMPDNATHQVALTFFIDPGNRVYVRDVTFSGSRKINDEVLRREMRQLEGGALSNAALERSKQRIQRLPYVKNVELETLPVTGSPDLMDVNFKLEDGSSAQLSGGVGYSEAYGIMLNGNFTEANFLGTGQRVGLDFSGGRYSKVYSIQHTDPYRSIDNLQRTISLSYRDISQFIASSSALSSKTVSAGITYAYPISEYQNFQFGGAVLDSELLTGATDSSLQARAWVLNNGRSYTRIVHDDPTNADLLVYGTRFFTTELNIGWSIDTRNRSLFPTEGMHHLISLSRTLPGAQVQYFIGTYDYSQYFHVPGIRFLPFNAAFHVNYGEALGRTTSLPPYRLFYLGGADSLRGFQEGFLGPRDSQGRPYGSDFTVAGQLQAIVPIPKKFETSARVTAFIDFGEGAFLGNTRFTDRVGSPVRYPFALDQIRVSTGLGVEWLSPMGLFRFSVAVPLRYKKNSELVYGDETERFQFSIGQAF